MRVDELRKALDQYDTATLKEIVVTLYKAIPKNKKESDGLDGLLMSFSKEKAKAPKKEPSVDFLSLKREIQSFLYNANQQNYLAPNRIIRKEQRSKWRFEVKRFIKVLLTVVGENSEDAANLLKDIYVMLSYACNYYIFATENPFSAVGYEQPDLLQLVLGKIFYSGYSPQAIKTAVFLTLDSNVDRETLHTTLMYVLAELLKTPDTKEMAAAQCVAFPKEYVAYQSAKDMFLYNSRDDYRAKDRSNYAAELYLIIKLALHEYDDGIKYFWKNYNEKRKEVTLYCLLWFLSDDGLEDLWLSEYEKALASGIDPRDYLQEEYKERKNAR
jgi:hypothetical protein